MPSHDYNVIWSSNLYCIIVKKIISSTVSSDDSTRLDTTLIILIILNGTNILKHQYLPILTASASLQHTRIVQIANAFAIIFLLRFQHYLQHDDVRLNENCTIFALNFASITPRFQCSENIIFFILQCRCIQGDYVIIVKETCAARIKLYIILTFLKYPPCSLMCPFRAGTFLNFRWHRLHSTGFCSGLGCTATAAGCECCCLLFAESVAPFEV